MSIQDAEKVENNTSEPHDYEDLFGNKFTLTNLSFEERREKFERKKKRCLKDQEMKEIIRHLFTPKPIDYSPVEVVFSSYKPKTVKKFYQPGLIVQVDNRTTEPELQRLFHVGARTLFLRLGYATPAECNQIMAVMKNAIGDFHKNRPYLTPIGIAVELRGHGLRTGRVVPVNCHRLSERRTNETVRESAGREPNVKKESEINL
ncbi:uncharacterized protein LOC119648380 isoform X2 [Hermetia illucens]|uniref:uncharacterized protein LOC119648380 isoform X2 n=1 Tax=Hermetia illucens TaxID=343691 RepID=UPI0018CC315E|nr:uncharacterized protein LOC119648380 isoform X2 [Hermetia illucens]